MARGLLKHLGMRTTGIALLVLPLLTVIAGGCGTTTPRIVTLMRSAPVTPNINAPLEVVSRATAIADPLPVRNSDIVYGDLEGALGTAVSTATAPWADTHKNAPHGGWTVLVEVTGADATLESGGRVVVGLDVRATLRTREGNVYLGQTQLNCRDGGLRSAEEGAPVIYRCMMRIGRDLAGWLGGGVQLDPPPPQAG